MIVPFARLLASLRMPRAARAVLRLYLKIGPGSLPALNELLALEIASGSESAQAEVCGQLLDTDPRHPDALRRLADIRLSQGNPQAAAGYFRRLHEATSNEPAIVEAYRSAFFDRERYRRGDGYVMKVKDVLVDTGYWAVLKNDRVYYLETHSRQFEKSPLVDWRATADLKYHIVSYPPPTLTVEPPCILLGGDENYSHWVTRNLLKLSLLDAYPAYRDLPYLINEDLQPHQREYLELLEIPERRLIRVPRGTVVRCRELIVPTVICNRPGMKEGIAWLRGRFAPMIEAAGEPRDLLFVSRRGAQRRLLLNEDELGSRLERLGFSTIETGSMTVRDQIAAFARAKVIVAPHGAALANLVFAPRNCLIIEIISTSIEHMDDFRGIGKALGQNMLRISSDDYEVDRSRDGPAMHWDYRVDVEEVLTTLRRQRLP